MQTIRGNTIFFFALLFGVIALSFFIFVPYLGALVGALVVSILIRPIHTFIAKRMSKGNERSNISTIFTLLFVLIVVIVPLILFGLQISNEARGVYTYLVENKEDNTITRLNTQVSTLVSRVAPETAKNIQGTSVAKYIQEILSWAFTSIDIIFSKVASLAIKSIIFAFALYYLIRDGAHVRRKLIELSPLQDMYDEKIFNSLEKSIESVVRGTLTAGVVQGVLLGVGLAIFGVPNPILWGSLCAIFALLPGVGTPMVVIPAALYLFTDGSHGAAVGLLVWLGLSILFVDNYLTPKLMNKGIHLNPFLVLLSVFGGLSFFGVSGLVLGPLILSLLFSLLDIYKASIQQPKSDPI